MSITPKADSKGAATVATGQRVGVAGKTRPRSRCRSGFKRRDVSQRPLASLCDRRRCTPTDTSRGAAERKVVLYFIYMLSAEADWLKYLFGSSFVHWRN